MIDTGIQEITEHGILDTEGKLREVDAIIYGTGFTATEFMAPMQITGLDGRTLKDTWKDGAEAYLGLTVNGFPNFFMLYGPNTNLGHNSIVYMIESQVNYILDALRTTLKNNLLFTNIRAEIQHEFNQNIQEKMKKRCGRKAVPVGIKLLMAKIPITGQVLPLNIANALVALTLKTTLRCRLFLKYASP